MVHRHYWHRVRKLDDIPALRVGIVNLHPIKIDEIPYECDGIVDRKNDIIYHDKTEFDESVAVLVSDYVSLGKALVNLADKNGINRNKIQKILQENVKTVKFETGLGIIQMLILSFNWSVRMTGILFRIRHLIFQKIGSDN